MLQIYSHRAHIVCARLCVCVRMCMWESEGSAGKQCYPAAFWMQIWRRKVIMLSMVLTSPQGNFIRVTTKLNTTRHPMSPLKVKKLFDYNYMQRLNISFSRIVLNWNTSSITVCFCIFEIHSSVCKRPSWHYFTLLVLVALLRYTLSDRDSIYRVMDKLFSLHVTGPWKIWYKLIYFKNVHRHGALGKKMVIYGHLSILTAYY